MAVTLKQIAEMAGVHKSTVDKVIHNRPGVSDAKRQQIKLLLEEYGYEANPLAKALNYQKKKMAVAVVMPEVDAMPYIRDGIELVRPDLNSFNIEIMYHIIPPLDAEKEAECLLSLCGSHIAGVVLLPIESPSVEAAMETLAKSDIPVVTVNSDLSNAPRFCFVGQDMVQAGQTAARMMQLFLPNGGRLAIISSRNMRAVTQREESFCTCLASNTGGHGIEIAETVLIQETPEEAYQAAAFLLEREPDLDALFITCGCVVPICKALQDHGSVNRPVTISYEKYPEIIELVRSGVIACTISGHLEGQGRIAMRILFEKLIYGRQPRTTRTYTQNEILLKENI